RRNRIAGLIKCALGIGSILLGAGLTYAVSVVLQQLVGMILVFEGLMFVGAAIVAYGGLSVLTARGFQMPRCRRNLVLWALSALHRRGFAICQSQIEQERGERREKITAFSAL